jgi:hypothetical protein
VRLELDDELMAEYHRELALAASGG